MLPRISLLTLGLIVLSNWMLAQDGKLAGKVFDDKGAPLEFATVVVYEGDLYRYGTQTRADGTFSIQPVSPGTYRVQARYLGASKSLDGVTVLANETKRVEIAFNVEKTIEEVVIEAEDPIRNSPIVGQTLTSDQVLNAGSRNVQSLAALTAGVYQSDEGGQLSIRGARNTSTVYYIDGVKIRGQNTLPQSSISQLQVITGGTPAEFGDFTGGVVNITTSGPSSTFSGGGELVTSQFLDAYGRNLAAVTLSGPLITKKRYIEGTDESFKTSVLGFFVNAEYDYNLDQDPAALGIFRLSDSLLQDLQQTPMQISADGLSFRSRANFVTGDQIESIRTKQNNESERIRGLIRFDFQPADNILIKLGGNAELITQDRWGINTMLYAPDHQAVFNGANYRGWFRFQQSFPGTETSAIRNLYYSIQADYSLYQRRFQNEVHTDNFFDYGFIGTYDFDFVPTYQYVSDPNDPLSSSPYWRSGLPAPTNLTFDGTNSANPLLANYNTAILNYVAENGIANLGFDPTSSDPIVNQLASLNELAFRQGLINGQRPGSIYSIFSGIGTNSSFYQKFDFEQFRLSGQATAEIRGHNLKAGFEFEQRVERFYSIGASNLWFLMRQYANFHLLSQSTDPNDFVYELNNGGEWNDTISIPLQAVLDDQTTFDRNVRIKLGLDPDGTDLINIDGQLPSFYSLDMFTADELLNDGLGVISYYGFDYLGNKQALVEDDAFLSDVNNRPLNAFRPTYISGFIQDKFEFEDIIFNIGVRVDRFDANQLVLKDNFSLVETYTAADIVSGNVGNISDFTLPTNIGADFVPYVDDALNPTSVVGYRDGEIWYDANGAPVSSAEIARRSGGRVNPAIVTDTISSSAFEDYRPQTVVQPRISFSFPISDVAQFFAHYDVLSQRPGQLLATQSSLLAAQISDYVFLANRPTSEVNNPNLQPEITIEYEAGFKQRLGRTMAMTISAYYREMRNMIRFRRFADAYPFAYDTYDNLDFGTTKGFSFSYDMRRTNNIALSASYTLQFSDATGSSFSDARNVTNFLEGVGVLRTPLPNGNDQRHRIAGNMDYRFVQTAGPSIQLGEKTIFPLKNAGLNATFYLGSGFPFTRNAVPVPSVASGVNIVNQVQGTVRGSRLPWQFRLDLRADKNFTFGGKMREDGSKSNSYSMQVYITMLNALDTRNIVGVYRYTGLPDDDGYLSSDTGQQAIVSQIDPEAYVDQYNIRLQNPNNFTLPRRTRLGVMFNF